MRTLLRVLGLATLIAALTVPFAGPSTAGAAGELDIFVCAGPYALVDSNMPGVQGPQVLTFCVNVTNTSGGTCENIDVYIGDGATPGTFPLGTDATTSLSLLSCSTDAHRFIPTLADGETKVLMWQLAYPPTDTITYDFTVWAQSYDLSCDGIGTHQITTRRSISAASNKLLGVVTVNPPSGIVSAGNIIEVTITDFDFGVVGDGYTNEEDAWLQPLGNLNFDPCCFRLVSTEVMIDSIDGSPEPPYFTMPYLNRLYFPGIKSVPPGTPPDYSNDPNDYVIYRFVALGECTTAIQPYQEVASGQVQIYSTNYGSPAGTISLTSEGGAIALDKSVNPLTAGIGETLTWTIEYHNTTALPVGDPGSGAGLVIIEQAIPADTVYLTGTAGCSGYACLIYYSTDGGANWSLTEPVPASDVNAIKWYITEVVPALGTGSVFFETEVTVTDGSICNTATAQIGESDEVIAESTACANAESSAVTAEKTVALFSEVDCGGQISAGDTVEYTVVITNTSGVPAQNVLYTDTPDANTPLVVGSVTTSHGFIDIGNTGGDTTVQVDVGTLAPAATVTITYRVLLADGDYLTISNQGLVTGDNVEDVDTDDPATEEEGDSTSVDVYPVQPCPPPPTVPHAVGGEAMQPDKVSIAAGLLAVFAALFGLALAMRRGWLVR